MPPPFTVHAGDDPGTDLGEWNHSGDIRIPGDLIVGGTVYTGQYVKPNKLENAVADLQDRVNNLENTTANAVGYRRGQTADAGPPTLDSPLFFNQQTSELWVPAGTGWVTCSLAAAPLVSGGSNAPTAFTAVVNSDNTVPLTWALPTPPSGYTISAVTVREKFKSPTGVSGMPLAGTATSNTRPASSAASTREYYVTCTFSKASNPDVESAESNHVTVVLPFGSTGGGGTGGGTSSGTTPAAILKIGTVNFFSVDVGNSGGLNVSHTMAEITGGFVQSPYFEPNATNDAVGMQTTANGGTT